MQVSEPGGNPQHQESLWFGRVDLYFNELPKKFQRTALLDIVSSQCRLSTSSVTPMLLALWGLLSLWPWSPGSAPQLCYLSPMIVRNPITSGFYISAFRRASYHCLTFFEGGDCREASFCSPGSANRLHPL